MENTASTGDPTTAVSNLWLVYTVAGNCQCGRAYRRLDLGFGFAPADYQQGNSYRIIYLHVPAAIWSMGIYASMAVAAFIGPGLADENGQPGGGGDGPIGAVFTFIATVTGSAWGKPMWGFGGYGMHV